MLIMTLFFVLLVVLLIGFIHYLILKENRKSTICAVAFLLVCCLVVLFIHIINKGYSYELSIGRENLEAFMLDLDTQQQYEEWFCPEERIERDECLVLSREIKFEDEPYRWVDVTLECYPDTQAAVESYNYHFNLERKYSPEITQIKILNADYDYYFTKTRTGPIEDYLFAI